MAELYIIFEISHNAVLSVVWGEVTVRKTQSPQSSFTHWFDQDIFEKNWYVRRKRPEE